MKRTALFFTLVIILLLCSCGAGIQTQTETDIIQATEQALGSTAAGVAQETIMKLFALLGALTAYLLGKLSKTSSGQRNSCEK